MENHTLTEERFIGHFSTKLAIGSFLTGTGLFVAHFTIPNDGIFILFGILFIPMATFLNALALINLAYRFSVLPQQREAIAIKMLLVLANVPIAFFYFNIVTKTF
jgi:hypothetical protein